MLIILKRKYVYVTQWNYLPASRSKLVEATIATGLIGTICGVVGKDKFCKVLIYALSNL